MARALGPLFWFETALAVTCGATFALWATAPQWIEAMFEVAPDGGSGSSELEIAIALLIATIACSILARGEWRRCQAR